MGVFDGGTYRVDVYREDPEDPDEEIYVDNPSELLQSLREDASVRAVETFSVHYVVGEWKSDLSFGNRYEEEEDE